MTFQLEALEAKYGDSLLLHFGTAAKPRVVVIDGGPKGVYGASLRPRLEQLRRGKKLSVDLLMVSHLDDDHVAGVVDLLDEIHPRLEGAGLMKKGRFECDVLKLPHHGSDRNVSTEFFQQVRARNYVVSANGRFGNPDTPTLEMIASARAGEKFKLWLTNHEGEKGVKARLDKFFAKDKTKSYEVVYRDPKKLGMTITP